MSVALELRDVTVSYGRITILRHISFLAKQGEFITVVGRSGSGKSTLLNAIADFIPYEGGISRPRRIGYVFQSYAVFPWLTVRGNIEFGIRDLSAGERRLRLDEMLQTTELAEFADRLPDTLSGGQVQRVALARTLAPDPELLLMDEPYAALDQHTRERMQSWLIGQWRGTGKTVVFVTHAIEEALFLADRVLVIREGEVVGEIVPPFPHPRSNEVRFEAQFADQRREVLRLLG